MAINSFSSIEIEMPDDLSVDSQPCTLSLKQQLSQVKGDIFCSCGGRMNRGQIKQGSLKCSMSHCEQEVSGTVSHYCPEQTKKVHRKGFFLCQCCAEKVTNGILVIPKQDTEPEQGRNKRRGKHSKPYQMPAKEGYMSRRRSFFKRQREPKQSWFKLYDNKTLVYSSEKYASLTEGHTDLSNITSFAKTGDLGIELATKKKSFSLLLSSPSDRDDWFDMIQLVCFNIDAHSDSLQVVEDDVDDSFVTQNCDNFEDVVPPPAYSRPSTPHTPPGHDEHFTFPDVPYCEEEGFFNIN